MAEIDMARPLDYEQRKRQFSWWNVVGWAGLCIYIAGLWVIFFLSDPQSRVVNLVLVTLAMICAIGVWAGIKYGVQKRDFWF
jgi:hypothetical protein